MGSHGSDAPVAYTASTAQTPVAVPAPTWTPDVPSNHPPKSLSAPSLPLATAPGGADSAPDLRTPEQKLDDILLGWGDENAKSDKLLALLTNSPAEAQEELSHHLINMTQDDHYDGVAQLLTNAATQTAVSTVLMNDLLNRRNTLKLPMLLAIASNTDHPLAGQAKDMLELFLQTDYGTNWNQWSDAVTTWLQQNSQ
jgi:hypothetical protein